MFFSESSGLYKFFLIKTTTIVVKESKIKNKILITLLTLSAGFAYAEALRSFIEKNPRELVENELNAFCNGERKDLVIKFSKGEKFPLNLFISGSILSLSKEETKPYHLSIERDFYMRIPNENTFLFSFNGEKWQPLLDIITGQIDAGLTMHEDSEELVSELSVTINPRKE